MAMLMKSTNWLSQRDQWDSDAFDSYLLAEWIFPWVDGFETGKVVARKSISDCNPIGHLDQNPLLDMHIYEAGQV